MVSKQKILIVDDDNNIAELISLYLVKECFETKICNDGETAINTFDTFKPNLVLLDLSSPASTEPGLQRAKDQEPGAGDHALCQGRSL